mmetsp:Transcript_27325/g.40677  ORF Transcript_27325/g.40677 Transcript_27325/m.40677 type:complete len:134 (+) Transcript_27325:898-1299(+)
MLGGRGGSIEVGGKRISTKAAWLHTTTTGPTYYKENNPEEKRSKTISEQDKMLSRQGCPCLGCFGQDCYTSNQGSHNFTKAKSPTATNIKQQNNIKPSCQKYTSTPSNNYTASVTLTLSRKCEATLPLGTRTT